MSFQVEVKDYSKLSEDHKKMIDKARYLKEQLIKQSDTRDYNYKLLGKIEVGISIAEREKNEVIRKILELNANIESLKNRYEKEITFKNFDDEKESEE